MWCAGHSQDAFTTDEPKPAPKRRKRDGKEPSQETIFCETSASIDEISAFAGRNCVSTACVYYTAWAMAISSLEGSKTVVVGGVFSNRASLPLSIPDQENVIGPFMSTLPLVFHFGDADERVKSRLHRTMDDLATVGEYAWARSDQVGVGRRMGNFLAMQLPLPNEHSKPPALRVESLENSDFPLTMLVEENGDLRILFDTTQFDAKTIRRVGEHFKHALYSLLHRTTVGNCMEINELQEAVLKQAARTGPVRVWWGADREESPGAVHRPVLRPPGNRGLPWEQPFVQDA